MLDFAPKVKLSKPTRLGLETILALLAIALLGGILLKVVLDIDTNYDPGWYHLPFAARLGGIMPREMFLGDEKWFEPRFDGFPLLAHTLQGFFWRITGRIQSTNLVSFLAIVGYIAFLQTWFKVPWYLGTIALMAIPLVQSHASTSFVDLLGNVGVSMLVMMTFRCYLQPKFPSIPELVMIVLGGAIAVNTKTQLQPLTFVILIVLGIRLGWLIWQKSITSPKLSKVIPVALLATLIIFASPVKNTLLYGNPLYPIKIQVGSLVLNHKLSPEAYEVGNRQINWLTSVLEIDAPQQWTPDQWGSNPQRNRRGGFFGLYVVFNLLLLLGFWFREIVQNKYWLIRKTSQATSPPPQAQAPQSSHQAKTALLTAVVMSLVPLNFPQSHELRYFMYWMICLVSLNLYLIALPKNRQLLGRWLQSKYMGLIYTIFLVTVLVKTNATFAKPAFSNLDDYVNYGVKQEFLSQIQPDEQVCLISKHIGEDTQAAPTTALKYAFVYSSYFHPEIKHNYSIQAALDPQVCGERRIIPQPEAPE